jgi:diguanylate cyclase (GGDEF)-like protein/PAS domain S-box-containing protein
MRHASPVVRLSAGLVTVTCTILLIADLAGIVPRLPDDLTRERIQLCEQLGMRAAVAASRDDLVAIRSALTLAVRQNEGILSAALRGENGTLLVERGDHRGLWRPTHEEGSTATHVRIPLFRDGHPWATLEVRFSQVGYAGLPAALWSRPLLRLLVIVIVLGFVGYLLYLRRSLRYLDPSSVIPARVQSTLDVMTEGVILVDEQERIVMANAAFTERFAPGSTSILGVSASTLGWYDANGATRSVDLPWQQTLANGRPCTGTSLRFRTADERSLVFTVNAAPVLDGWGRPKGSIVTLDDVSELEEKKAQLEEALAEIEKSRDEVRLQNEELEQLARKDPLTGIANRRAFMSLAEDLFRVFHSSRGKLSLLMVDIDHFKRINDKHGHSIGDEVIRRIAEALALEVRAADSVCRYGGEEFCIVLPNTMLDGAVVVAERIRNKIRLPGFARVPVTASFGVSSLECGADALKDLIDQADQALYAAKRAGRDRVGRFDEIDAEPEGETPAATT